MARPTPLAEFLDACISPVFAAQGFASADILAAWPDIVGDRLARVAQPQKLEWPRRRGPREADRLPEPATLVLRVEGAFALEVQHLAPLIVERLNAHYGWRCVGRLVLKQGRMRRAPPPKAAPPPLDPARAASLEAAVEPIAEDGLRDALARLGTAVLGDRR